MEMEEALFLRAWAGKAAGGPVCPSVAPLGATASETTWQVSCVSIKVTGVLLGAL